MELDHHDDGFLEELLEFSENLWEQPITNPPETMSHHHQLNNHWNLDFLDENLPLSLLPNTPPSSHQDLNPFDPCFLVGDDLGIFQMFEEAEPAPAKNKPPSKNLMAERRRRMRLNDRLSMLRSIVPKITKMDRTSILGDTIDYMKELLEKINNLQQEAGGSNHPDLIKDQRPNEVSITNSPKFDVERRNGDTRIAICCAAKPGLLASTVCRVEELGLQIEQCVISCFNDFAMQASCSHEMEHTRQNEMASCEDIKQVLFTNAGYGGKCL